MVSPQTSLLFFADVVTVPCTNKPPLIPAAATKKPNDQRKFFRLKLLSRMMLIELNIYPHFMQSSIIVFVQPLKDGAQRLERRSLQRIFTQ